MTNLDNTVAPPTCTCDNRTTIRAGAAHFFDCPMYVQEVQTGVSGDSKFDIEQQRDSLENIIAQAYMELNNSNYVYAERIQMASHWLELGVSAREARGAPTIQRQQHPAFSIPPPGPEHNVYKGGWPRDPDKHLDDIPRGARPSG